MVHTIDSLSIDNAPKIRLEIGDQMKEPISGPELMLTQKNGNSFRFYTAIFFSCIGGFLFGYDTGRLEVVSTMKFTTSFEIQYSNFLSYTGIISGAMLLMKSEFNLTLFEQSAIVSVFIQLIEREKNPHT